MNNPKLFELVNKVLDIAMRSPNLTAEEKDQMAAASWMIGSNHYQELGFSAVPNIVEPPPPTDEQVSNLFTEITYTIKTVDVSSEAQYLSGEFVAYRFVSVQVFEGETSVVFYCYRLDFRINNTIYVSLSDGSSIREPSLSMKEAMKAQAIRMQFGEITEFKD